MQVFRWWTGMTVVLAAIGLVGCSDSGDSSILGSGETVTESFVPGTPATLSIDGLAVEVPGNASLAPIEITVTSTTEQPPSGLTAVSPIYEFGPAGTTFDVPVTVRFPNVSGASDAAVFWKGPDDTDYIRLASTQGAGTVEAQVTHFSKGFAGVRKQPTGPTGPFRVECGEDRTDTITGALATTAPPSGETVHFRAVVEACASDSGILGHIYLRYVHEEEVACGQRVTFRTSGDAVDPTNWMECDDCQFAFGGLTFDPSTSFGAFCDGLGLGDGLDRTIFADSEFLVLGEHATRRCVFGPYLSGGQWRYWNDLVRTSGSGGASWENQFSEERTSCTWVHRTALSNLDFP